MSVAPARRPAARDWEPGSGRRAPVDRRPAPAEVQARARAERRRRQRHFARRRRDLLEDVGLALVLTLILISLTAGLGVIALLEGPLAAGLTASVLLPRRRRRRAAQAPAPRSHRRSQRGTVRV